MNPRTRKKLVATASRREGVYNRAGEPSVTFCEKEEQGSGRMAYFLSQTKNKPEQSELCSDVSKDYKKDIFSILADGVELLHKRLRLLYITFNFMVAGKNYLYFLF